MQASEEEKASWVAEARRQGATRILIVCDTFSYEQYPVYCRDEAELQSKTREYNSKSMQRTEGVIVVKRVRRKRKKG
jgi:hypothetical protein